jgi:hypothetical protein
MGQVPAGARSARERRLLRSFSEIVRDINKYRQQRHGGGQLFLTLGALSGGVPGTLDKGAAARFGNGSRSAAAAMPELVLDNGIPGCRAMNASAPAAWARCSLRRIACPVMPEVTRLNAARRNGRHDAQAPHKRRCGRDRAHIKDRIAIRCTRDRRLHARLARTPRSRCLHCESPQRAERASRHRTRCMRWIYRRLRRVAHYKSRSRHNASTRRLSPLRDIMMGVPPLPIGFLRPFIRCVDTHFGTQPRDRARENRGNRSASHPAINVSRRGSTRVVMAQITSFHSRTLTSSSVHDDEIGVHKLAKKTTRCRTITPLRVSRILFLPCSRTPYGRNSLRAADRSPQFRGNCRVSSGHEELVQREAPAQQAHQAVYPLYVE